MIVAVVALALLLVAVAAVLQPVLAPEVEPTEEGPDAEALGAKEEEKERVLESIRDLDMDFATLKLSADDYQRLRSHQVAEAGRLILEIESSEPASASPSGAGSTLTATDESPRDAEDPAEAAPDPSCPACGLRHYSGDRFCRLCGTTLVRYDASS